MIDRMIVKVAGAAWRLIEVTANVRVAPTAGAVEVDILAKMPGESSYATVFDSLPSIAIGQLSSSGGAFKSNRRILPIGTLVRLGDTDNNIDTTIELHYRTRAVSQ